MTYLTVTSHIKYTNNCITYTYTHYTNTSYKIAKRGNQQRSNGQANDKEQRTNDGIRQYWWSGAVIGQGTIGQDKDRTGQVRQGQDSSSGQGWTAHYSSIVHWQLCPFVSFCLFDAVVSFALQHTYIVAS